MLRANPWILVLAAVTVPVRSSAQESTIPPMSEFLMVEGVEIAIARSAAPASISDHATVMVLGQNGYETRIQGTNGFVCLVLRSWGHPNYDEETTYRPKYRVPECLDANAVATILPMQLTRAELAVRRAPPGAINQAVKDGYRSGRFRRTETVSFSYMLSNAMTYSVGQPGQPHIMVYLPDSYSNDLAGGLSSEDGALFVEGGPDEPYTAAVIRRPGIDPAPSAHDR